MNRVISLLVSFFLGFQLVVGQNTNCTNTEFERFIYIGHPRGDANPDMDSVVEKIEYKNFSVLMLGGDLADETSIDDATIDKIDSVFDFSSLNTLWSIGNHDDYSLTRVQSRTKRPTYYSYYKNGITYIVFNTQDSSCSVVGDQRIFFESVIDTVSSSSHVIILMHKLIYLNDHSTLQTQIPQISNAPYGVCTWCINENNFYDYVYPKLIGLEQKGIDVICIGGDIGKNSKSFEHETSDGIVFLASGCHSGDVDNSAIVFYHDILNRDLNWDFKLTTDFSDTLDHNLPNFHSISLSEDTIEIGKNITVVIEVSDSISIIDKIQLGFTNDLNTQTLSPSSDIGKWTLIDKNKYSISVKLEDSLDLGNWKLDDISILDISGNQLCVSNIGLSVNLITSTNPLINPDPKLTIYPNPSSGILSLSISDNIKSLIVYSLSGKEIKIKSDSFKNIDLSTQKPGVYFVLVTTFNNVKIMEKIVIQK